MKVNAFYDVFFAGFGLVTGALTTFDENVPVCGGFGFPRILITSLRFLLFGRRQVAESLLPGSCACRSFRLTGHPIKSDAHSRVDGGIECEVAA